eukprot:4563230-Amphidinium_carterae.1
MPSSKPTVLMPSHCDAPHAPPLTQAPNCGVSPMQVDSANLESPPPRHHTQNMTIQMEVAFECGVWKEPFLHNAPPYPHNSPPFRHPSISPSPRARLVEADLPVESISPTGVWTPLWVITVGRVRRGEPPCTLQAYLVEVKELPAHDAYPRDDHLLPP